MIAIPLEQQLAERLAVALKMATASEFRFHATRKWRADVMLFDADGRPVLAVELDGGKGRHRTFIGSSRDAEKRNALVAMRIYQLTFPTSIVRNRMDDVVSEISEIVCGQVPTQSCMLK